MRITVIRRFRTPAQTGRLDCMMDGLVRAGFEPTLVDGDHTTAPTKAVAVWGWRNGEDLRRNGHEVIVMENGYIGDRTERYFSLGLNGLNGHAWMPEYPVSGHRFMKHGGELMPARRSTSGLALILGQMPDDASIRDIGAQDIYTRVIKGLKAHGYRVRFRHHPVGQRIGRNFYVDGCEVSTAPRPIEEDLADAQFGVVINSNSAVDCILSGLPCVALDAGTMAYEMCAHDFNTAPVLPPFERRLAWAQRLAYKQWECHEIAGGYPLLAFYERLKTC